VHRSATEELKSSYYQLERPFFFAFDRVVEPVLVGSFSRRARGPNLQHLGLCFNILQK
jgi:hypothetical protein